MRVVGLATRSSLMIIFPLMSVRNIYVYASSDSGRVTTEFGFASTNRYVWAYVPIQQAGSRRRYRRHRPVAGLVPIPIEIFGRARAAGAGIDDLDQIVQGIQQVEERSCFSGVEAEGGRLGLDDGELGPAGVRALAQRCAAARFNPAALMSSASSRERAGTARSIARRSGSAAGLRALAGRHRWRARRRGVR